MLTDRWGERERGRVTVLIQTCPKYDVYAYTLSSMHRFIIISLKTLMLPGEEINGLTEDRGCRLIYEHWKIPALC